MSVWEQSYIVAATPRTGSSLLCEGLFASGIAGRPGEVFAPGFRDIWTTDWSLPRDAAFDDFLDAAYQYGTTMNGMYGMKIQWMHVATLADEMGLDGDGADVLDLLFPGAKFVNIVRRDRRAQALSWYRAVKTNEWWRFKDDPRQRTNGGEPAFDAQAIRKLEHEIERQQSAWAQYFRRRRVQWMTVEYEALDRDYRGEVARVLHFLGLNRSAARWIPAPRLDRQSDDLTIRWRELMEAGIS